MTECMNAEMRDALPDFIHGQLDPARTADVRAHVVTCAECAAEVEILRLVVASAPSAPQMDVEKIAGALPVPTRHGFLLHRGGGRTSSGTSSISVPPSAARPSRIWSRPAVRVAAAVAIVAAGGLSLLAGRDVLRPEAQVGQTVVARTQPVQRPAASVVAAPPASLPASAASTSTEERQQVAVASSTALSLPGELRDLSDEHLAVLLNDINKMDALPAAEPETVEPAVNADGSLGGDQ